MPTSERCRSCENCLQYYEFESIKIRKKREKERKKRGLLFPCTADGAVTKKPRLSEAETMNDIPMTADATYQRRDGCAAQFQGSWGRNGL